MKTLSLFFLLLAMASVSFGQHILAGDVSDSHTGEPLRGATIAIKGDAASAKTNENGRFELECTTDTIELYVSYMGYVSRTLQIHFPLAGPVEIKLDPKVNQLDEIEVSTGYQRIPITQATGSFVHIGNELLNRRVSPNIMDRLEDVAVGLSFNRNRGSTGSISIRGQSTIYADAEPLIVVDNFPYYGGVENINPNDIEDITLLKDAAAASIWGSKSGNGVIVITTKKGRTGQPLDISFNSNVTVGAIPDYHYQRRMSATEFIEVEKMLFQNGFYAPRENALARTPLTPVVELLIAHRDGHISEEALHGRIEELNHNDIRHDYTRYFLRNTVDQQYSLSLKGASQRHQYYISAGYDKGVSPLVGDGNDRFTLNFNHAFNLMDDKVKLTTGIWLTQHNRTSNSIAISDMGLHSGNPQSLYPYAAITDRMGNPATIIHDYRKTYLDTIGGLLDWTYSPLDELARNNNGSKMGDYRMNTSLQYQLIDGMNLNLLYQFGRAVTDIRNINHADAYFARDMVNRFTQDTGFGYEYPVPIGAIANLTNGMQDNHNVRIHMDFKRNTADGKHSVYALGGYEIGKVISLRNSFRRYGYDEQHSISNAVDYANAYAQFHNTTSRVRIPHVENESIIRDNSVSYYVNFLYSYRGRYSVSGSARYDQSNLFGVETNQKGVPLWSLGANWNIANEDFYTIPAFPTLRAKVSFGYNGNVDKGVTAYTTAMYLPGAGTSTNLPYANITNPPNPQLRWERIKVVNASLEFASRRNVISGTVEYYRKWGQDLVGDAEFSPSSGITRFRTNTANTKGKGVDVSLQSRNIDKTIKWSTNFMYSYNVDRVTGYAYRATPANYVSTADAGGRPLEGRPLYSFYSFAWAGLDPQTGDPQGYLDGEVSKDYLNVIRNVTVDDLVYSGPARPTDFGAIRNTLSLHNITLSFNISYRFGHYFRKSGIDYNQVLNGLGYNTGGEYASRWQRPGDERWTHVPSMPETINANRNDLYRYSEVLVRKGDNIRLQDIALSYALRGDRISTWNVKRIEIYAYANNIGLLWKAHDGSLDPDFPLANHRPVRTIACGVRIDF